MSFNFDEFDFLLSEKISPQKNAIPDYSLGNLSSLNEYRESKLPIFTVSDFVDVSNDIFEKTLPNVFVEGEISNFKINQNKFIFFDLKDKYSSIGCFMMLFNMRFHLEDGMKVRALVRPKLTQWGKFSLTVQHLQPIGEGNLKKSFDILKDKLNKEGIFSIERKRQITNRAKDIAVISSVQAAGYADFIKILNERWGGVKIRVAHTQVQGLVASEQIISAIDFLNSQDDLPELIAIIRGGGSADDLACFNDEKLVRTIAKSRIPIITGIGHETDETLSDLAADFAASTPSNVAQIIVPDKRAEVSYLRSKVERAGEFIIKNINSEKHILYNRIIKINHESIRRIKEFRAEILSKKRILDSLNPERVLRQGYAIISGSRKIGEILNIETSEEIILTEVKNVKQK